MLKSVSYDRNVVQFYGTCPHGDQTMLVLEYMEVRLCPMVVMLQQHWEVLAITDNFR